MMGTKRTNKVVSRLLCLAMIMTVLPVGVLAAVEETPEISLYAKIVEGTSDEQIDSGAMLVEPLATLTDFTREITLPGDYISRMITIENKDYEFVGFIQHEYDEQTETVTYSLTDTFTISPAPEYDTEEWHDWYTPISDGVYAAYVLKNETHVHYANDENEWTSDDLYHKQRCDGCDDEFNDGLHVYTVLPVCSVCGNICTHNNSYLLGSDEVKHWDMCPWCTRTVKRENHMDENTDKLCDDCEFDMSKWHYFGFSNSYDDFFAAGEKKNYAINDYEDDFIEWIGDRYSYPGWRNDIQMILDLQYSSWGGSCFGYAAVEVLFNLGLLDFEDYDPDMYAITQFPAPSKTSDKDIRSLLNYYYLTQFLAACRNDSYNLYGNYSASGRQEMLDFAEYIVSEQNKAMFCYFFTENGYTYGHAFVVDGGVENQDGSYTLNAYDNRYHGYKWTEDNSDVVLQVQVNTDGTASVYTLGGRAYKGSTSGRLYEFEEVITSFEYYKADETSFATFESLLPWDENMIDMTVVWVYAPKVVLVPANAQATETMKVSTDEFEVCVNDFAEGTPETEAIGESYMIYGGLSSVSSDGVANENTPGGVMFELNGVADSYEIASPTGTVSLSTENGLTTLTTDGAANAEFNTVSGAVSVDNNAGDFSITVTTSDGTIARVSGTANGDITVTPKESTVELSAPNGTYNVEYTKTDGTVTEDTITIRPKSTGGGGTTRYTIKFETNGGSTIANKTVTRNSKLAEPEAPTKDGYSFIGWFTDEELTTAYDFDSKVTKAFTLYAKWAKHDDETPATFENPFTDVDASDWYYADVMYAAENGLMGGTTETTFAPNTNITRAMLVTVLYRLEGEPSVGDDAHIVPPFADVDMGAYYANAVIWAKQNDIVKGVSETEFAPDENITREQIAAIMHRYAQYKGYDVSVGENTNILSYDDFADISEYAIAPMQYAAGSGLMKGKSETTLNPKDFATRAEIAAIVHRFIEANK